MKNQKSFLRFFLSSLLSVFITGFYASDELIHNNLNKSKKSVLFNTAFITWELVCWAKECCMPNLHVIEALRK